MNLVDVHYRTPQIMYNCVTTVWGQKTCVNTVYGICACFPEETRKKIPYFIGAPQFSRGALTPEPPGASRRFAAGSPDSHKLKHAKYLF